MAEELERFFSAYPDVDAVHFHRVTLSGTLETRCVTKRRCLLLASTASPLKISLFSLNGLCPWHLLTGRTINGSDTLYPDWSSVRYLGGREASVLCNVSEERSGHPDVDPSQPFSRCPRSTLQRVIQSGLENHQVEFLAGFEIEFYLVSPEAAADPSTFDVPAAFNHVSAGAVSFRDKRAYCVQACVRGLEKSGIIVEQFHACGGPFQYEISTGPLPLLAAVDTLVQSLEIIRGTAIANGYRALFIPEAFQGLETCGLHMHLSMAGRNGQQLQSSGDKPGESFLAGVLQRLPLLTALGMPLDISYARLGEVAAGSWVCWGFENRDVPIRAVEGTHWEFRAIDAAANVYLVAAGYIASGLLGRQSHQPLRMAPLTKSLRELDDDDKVLKQSGVTTRLPSCLADAFAFISDPTCRAGLDEALGPQILNFYQEVKLGEQTSLSSMDKTERLKLYAAIY
ncbi:glutamine synthetase bacteria [Fusarium albosuccineum]|uniref:Glutamine synthetase bacteria n=1 Tax=Fusarium albosuccineum TaxID=1237068 RepID=A0A8H4L320_9HYPO|nr:glutamine synthetase bacteria [Fusarium albosuccineum]